MSAPLPFLVAQQIGNNLGQGFRQTRDENAIESILSGAMNSQDPAVLQNSISKILSQVSPERQGAAVQYIQNAYNNLQSKQQENKRRSAAESVGINPDLPEGLQKVQYENQLLDNRANSIIGGMGVNANPAQIAGGLAAGQSPQGQQGPQGEQTGPVSWRGLSDDQLVQLSGVKGFSEPAKQELKRRQEERNVEQRKDENRTKFGQDIGKKVLERTDEIAETLPQKRSALRTMVDAIASKDLSFWTWDNLAELSGVEAFRSPEGALFKTAAKEYFLGSLARAGARPNQWIEQQISDMLTKIGRTPEANLSVARALQNELDIEEERVRVTNEIADEIEREGGNYRSLGGRVKDRLSKYAEDKQEQLFNDLRAIKAIGEDKPQKFHKVAQGTQISPYMVDALLMTFGNDPDKALAEARKLGYAIDE